MKLLIAVDMEGITGVLNWNHVDPSHPEYQRFRRLMTQDVNAAIQGAYEGGVDEVVLADGHSFGDNILVEEIDPRARLNAGSPSRFAMVQGIDQAVDGVFFVGYHARMGTPEAILDHTWSSARVQNVWLNGRLTGEIGLNASLCGHYNAPVLLITGDQSANQEAAEWIDGLEHVVVKQATSRTTAELLTPAVTHALICEAAARAVINYRSGKHPACVTTQNPVTVTIELLNSDLANRASLLPGSRRLDGRKLEITAPDMPEAYRAFRSVVALAAV